MVLPHPVFTRKGNDLYTRVPVDFYTAVLGGEVSVPTLGNAVRLTIPENTDTGKVFRLKGLGMPSLKNPQTRGNLYATVEIHLPPHLTPAEKAKVRELKNMRRVLKDAALLAPLGQRMNQLVLICADITRKNMRSIPFKPSPSFPFRDHLRRFTCRAHGNLGPAARRGQTLVFGGGKNRLDGRCRGRSAENGGSSRPAYHESLNTPRSHNAVSAHGNTPGPANQ